MCCLQAQITPLALRSDPMHNSTSHTSALHPSWVGLMAPEAIQTWESHPPSVGGSISLSEALTLKFHPREKAFRGEKVFLRAKYISARTCDCSSANPQVDPAPPGTISISSNPHLQHLSSPPRLPVAGTISPGKRLR